MFFTVVFSLLWPTVPELSQQASDFRLHKFTHSETFTMPNESDNQTWPDLAIGLYDRLTGRDAEISYDFDNFELNIPSSTAADAVHARWKMNGVVRITTRNGSHSEA